MTCLSRKEVQSHVSTKLNIKHLDLDVYAIEGGLRIVGRQGIDKTFTSNRAAKAFVTRLDNTELCRRADARMALYA